MREFKQYRVMTNLYEFLQTIRIFLLIIMMLFQVYMSYLINLKSLFLSLTQNISLSNTWNNSQIEFPRNKKSKISFWEIVSKY